MKTVFSAILLLAIIICHGSAEDNKGMFIISPQAGVITSDVNFTSPGSGNNSSINDSGALYALSMMYISPQFTLGSMVHFSALDNSRENGYLFYALYNFLNNSNIWPSVGFYSDYIGVYTKATAADAAPLNSLNVDSSIWAFHTIAGLTIKLGEQRIMPFVGYFNEEVDTSLASEGMLTHGQTRNGFSADGSSVLDYMTAGIKADLALLHFIRFDAKIYNRFSRGEQALFTARTRLDFLLSKRSGISVKYDYFDDIYEKNTFAMIGPFFVF